MIKDRILSTLRFFDLQDYPLTLLELHRFLIADFEDIKKNTEENGEIRISDFDLGLEPQVSLDEILECLEKECQGQAENTLGFYHLPARAGLARQRLDNYFYGIKREKLISKYVRGLKYLPFIKGLALGGSQAFGQQREGSDIDLLVITQPQYMWLARMFITTYFQVFGKRRHGKKIANRFCLNHYVGGEKNIKSIKNLYSAMEYARLRPLVFGNSVALYQKNNQGWINLFFPNWQPMPEPESQLPWVKKVLEKLVASSFGPWLEKKIKQALLPRIKQGPFIIVEDDELSFHPESKQQQLLADFSKLQEQNKRVAEQLVV